MVLSKSRCLVLRKMMILKSSWVENFPDSTNLTRHCNVYNTREVLPNYFNQCRLKDAGMCLSNMIFSLFSQGYICRYLQDLLLPDPRHVEGHCVYQGTIPGIHRLPGKESLRTESCYQGSSHETIVKLSKKDWNKVRWKHEAVSSCLLTHLIPFWPCGDSINLIFSLPMSFL